MDSIIYLLYVMGGFICNLSLLYVNPLFVLCDIYIIARIVLVKYVLYYYDLFHILLLSD
jgi:hypothetical protein